jgi:hypothetical protein
MSLLDKFFNKTEVQDDEDVVIKTKATMRRVQDLKVGDEIIVTQRVRIVDKRLADDRNIGSLATSNVVFMELKAIGGVFNNLKAIATASERDKVEMARGQVKANAQPAVALDNDRDEDEMHGSYSPLNSR